MRPSSRKNAGAAAMGKARAALREHRRGDAVWITTPRFEAAGHALGLPDPAIVERLLTTRSGDGLGGGRAPTRIEPLPGQPEQLHVRRVLHGGWWAPLWRGRIAGLGRVRRELALTARLHAAGAPVPPAAFAVARRDGVLWRAALGTVHLDGAVDGIRYLGEAPPAAAIEAAARAAGQAVRRMHDLGLRHADLHLGNLLLRAEEGGMRAWVIDLDRARAGHPATGRRRRRECRRLARSLRKRGYAALLEGPAAEAFRAGYGAAACGAARPGDGRAG